MPTVWIGMDVKNMEWNAIRLDLAFPTILPPNDQFNSFLIAIVTLKCSHSFDVLKNDQTCVCLVCK